MSKSPISQTMSFSICLVLGMLTTFVKAADIPHDLATPELQKRYQVLLEELRCLVCQNQSLADSHAELAQDLRDEVHRMLQEGLSDDEIHGFMVARYGDFVLYKPPMKTSTILLWFGPFALIALALFILWRHLTKQQRNITSLTEEEEAYAVALRDSNGLEQSDQE